MTTKILITVDSEIKDNIYSSYDGFCERIIFGRKELNKESECWGIPEIIRITNKYDIKSTYFVDILEHLKWDKDIVNVIDYLKANKQDIQLHLHPSFLEIKDSDFLYNHSYVQQKEIITTAYNLFYKLVGNCPIAFRAGSYSINNDTIKIIDEMGIKFDSSIFYGNKNCGMIK